MNTQKAVVVSREIWLPPSSASLPNVCMVANNIPTNNTIGRRETKGEGIFSMNSFCLLYQLKLCKVTTNLMIMFYPCFSANKYYYIFAFTWNKNTTLVFS